jgi:hypothetical protein
MVWAMNKPHGFGDFCPKGDFVGWDDRLEQYFNSKMPAEQKAPFLERGSQRYISYVAEKFINERGREYGGLPVLTAVEPHEAPEIYKTEKTHKSLGSLIMLPNQILAVDEPLKSTIERLEPNKHEFFQIKITMAKGQVYPKPYYLLLIGQYFNAFSPQQSKVGSWKNSFNEGFYSVGAYKEDINGLAFSKDVYGAAHLWCEKQLITSLVFFSDQLKAEIDKAGLRIPKHFRAVEV